MKNDGITDAMYGVSDWHMSFEMHTLGPTCVKEADVGSC